MTSYHRNNFKYFQFNIMAMLSLFLSLCMSVCARATIIAWDTIMKKKMFSLEKSKRMAQKLWLHILVADWLCVFFFSWRKIRGSKGKITKQIIRRKNNCSRMHVADIKKGQTSACTWNGTHVSYCMEPIMHLYCSSSDVCIFFQFYFPYFVTGSQTVKLFGWKETFFMSYVYVPSFFSMRYRTFKCTDRIFIKWLPIPT